MSEAISSIMAQSWPWGSQIAVTKKVVHASIHCSCFIPQQPLRGEIFKIFGKGGEPYMGGPRILWGVLINS